MEVWVWLVLVAAAFVMLLAVMGRRIKRKPGSIAAAMLFGVSALGATDLTMSGGCCARDVSSLGGAVVLIAFGAYSFLVFVDAFREGVEEGTADAQGGPMAGRGD